MRRRSGTSFTCFTTKPVGVQRRKTATIQKAAFTHTTHVISADPTISSGMLQKTAKLFKMAWVGTTVKMESSATSATRLSSVSTTQKNTSALSVTALAATKWIFAPSSITLVRKIWLTSFANNIWKLGKASNSPTSISCTRNFCTPTQKNSRNSTSRNSNKWLAFKAKTRLCIPVWMWRLWRMATIWPQTTLPLPTPTLPIASSSNLVNLRGKASPSWRNSHHWQEALNLAKFSLNHVPLSTRLFCRLRHLNPRSATNSYPICLWMASPTNNKERQRLAMRPRLLSLMRSCSTMAALQVKVCRPT